MSRFLRVRYPLTTRLFFAWKVLLGEPVSFTYDSLDDKTQVEFAGRAAARRMYGVKR